MSTSPSRIAANRANARKSTGPRTPEGKARVSQSALTHGLTAKSVVLNEESQDAFHALRRHMFEDLDPHGEIECQLVESMVVARWRLTRAWELETALFNQSLADLAQPAARAYTQLAPTLDRLGRYESRLQRDYDRSLRRLLQLRKLRTTPPPQQPKRPAEPIRHDQLISTDEYIRLQLHQHAPVQNKPNPSSRLNISPEPDDHPSTGNSAAPKVPGAF